MGVDDTNKTYPQANHPVVRTNPQTGRKALFIIGHLTKINELSERESNAFLTSYGNTRSALNTKLDFAGLSATWLFETTATACTGRYGIIGPKR